MKFESFLIHPAVQSVGWALLHFVWEGALLAALLFAADLFIGRSRARLSYAIGCLVMLSMLAVFLGTIFRASSTARVSVTLPSVKRLAVSAVATQREGTPVAAVPVWTPRPANRLPGWAVCLWLAGLAVFSAYTAAGWIRVCALRWRAITPLHPAALETLMRRLRISPPVRLCVSAIAEVPAVIGWLRPCILIPVAALAGLSESQLRAVLAHELAHIRRHDYLVNMLQTVVETLLFYHPAVWWVSRRIREEREHCCDDLAISVCGDVMVYAGALAQLEELRGAMAQPALAATGGDLLSRIRRLLGEQSARGIPSAAGAAIAATLLLGVAISIAGAQTPAPKIEAVSVKPCDASAPPAGRAGMTLGRLSMQCVPVGALISIAYGEPMNGTTRSALTMAPVESSFKWIDSARYSIDAKAEGPESVRVMRGAVLRAILEERFHLKTHEETRQIPDYELTVAKGGPKLHAAAEGSCTPRNPDNPRRVLGADEKPYCGTSHMGQSGMNTTADLRGVTMEELTDFIQPYMDRLVYNKTGIAGRFDLHLEFVLDETMRPAKLADAGEPSDPLPPLANTIQQFGLKLVPAKGPGQFLVIDHVERPSEN